MDWTSQFVLAILTILCSGVASAAVTYKLNASRSKREFKREKLETLFQAIHGHCKTIRMATASWPLVITGRATATTVLERQIQIYLDSPSDIDRCTLLVALYFRELETDLDLIIESSSDLNAFIEDLAQKSQLPEGS